MYEEREDETPEWEIEDEKIPESLEKKWLQEEQQGLKAGVCRSCGYPFTQAELSCRHCGTPTEITEGVFASLRRFFFKTPLGILTLIIIFVAIVLFLVVR